MTQILTKVYYVTAIIVFFTIGFAWSYDDEGDVTILVQQTPFPKSDEELSSYQRVIAPLFLSSDERPIDDILLYIPAHDSSSIHITTQPFLKAIQVMVTDEAFLKIHDEIHKTPFFDSNFLLKDGWGVKFDKKAVSLTIIIPPKIRTTQVHRFVDRNIDEPLRTLSPASHSGYLNINVAEQFRHDSTTEQRQPVSMNFDAVYNCRSYVLEGDFTYTENGEPSWVRGPFRIVKDLPEHMIRLTVGDLTYPTEGFQQSLSMGGIALSKNFDLQPHYIAHPINSQEIFLTSPSIVEVWINEALYQTLHLSSGSHHLQDIPVTIGINDVRLKVLDNVGREMEFEFPYIFARSLLAPKISQWSYAIGPRSHSDDSVLQYPCKNSMFSHFYRRGITDQLTLGEYLQADCDQGIIGIEGSWGMPYGLLGFDMVGSNIWGSIAGFSLQLYISDFPDTKATEKKPWIASWNSSLTLTSRHFAQIGTTTPNNNIRGVVNGNIGYNLWYSVTGKLGAEYQLLKEKRTSPVNFSLNLRKSFSHNASVNISMIWNRNLNDEKTYRTTLNFAWRIPAKNQMLTCNHDFASNKTKATWNNKSSFFETPLATSLSLEHNHDNNDTDVTGTASCSWHRGILKATHSISDLFEAATEREQITQLSLNTALVYAGGHFGISKPVSQSFAIITKGRSLKDLTIGINKRNDDTYQTQADVFGPGIVENISNYQHKIISIDSSTIPFGMDIGPANYCVTPQYKNGFHISLTMNSSVVIAGILTDSSNNSLTLIGGKFMPINDDEDEPHLFFTNRNGKFEIPGLSPGEYKLTLFSGKWLPITIAIPQNASQMYDVGTITLSEEHGP